MNKVKVLMLNVNRSGWHSGNMIYDMECVQHACDTVVYGPGWPNYKFSDVSKIIQQIYGSNRPDIIYSFMSEGEKLRDCYIQRYNIPHHLCRFPTNVKKAKGCVRIFALTDFWTKRPHRAQSDLHEDFPFCFGCFAPPFGGPDFINSFHPNVRDKIKFIGHPRCIDSTCFKDYKKRKEYDIISLGAMWSFYPLRVRMHQWMSQNYNTLGIRYKNYPHCGTDFTHSNFVREKYAQAINGSRSLISCGGKYKVAMNKIFEAWACNTAYIGDRPWGHEELHMKDGFNYIEVTKDNFTSKIKEILNEPELMSNIAKNGIKTFEKYHTIEARAQEFIKKIKTI